MAAAQPTKESSINAEDTAPTANPCYNPEFKLAVYKNLEVNLRKHIDMILRQLHRSLCGQSVFLLQIL